MLTDLYDCRERRFIDRQLWLDLPGPLDEQLHGAVRGQRREFLRRRRGMQLVLGEDESIDVNNHSAWRFRRSRVVTTTVMCGACASIADTRSAPASRCSKVSSTSSMCRARSALSRWAVGSACPP